MKKTMIVAALLATAGAANAQSFFESFETGLATTGTLPTYAAPGAAIPLASGSWYGLNLSSPIGTTGIFGSNLLTTPFGSQHAAMNFNNGAGVSNLATYLFTPVVTLNNGDSFSFYSRTVNAPSFADRLRLRLSTSGASVNPADFASVLVTINPNLIASAYPSTWTQYSVTISGLAGPVSGRFAFQYDVPSGGPSGANSDFIGIDSVQYTAVPAPGALALLGLGGLAAARRRR